MTDDDTKLAALFAEGAPIADDGFTKRVIALAALEDRLAARRRSSVMRIATEGVALASVLAVFAALARLGPPSAVVPLASPAMVGLILLGLWLVIGQRGAVRA